MPEPWFPRQTPATVAANNAAAQQAALDEIAQSTDATEQLLSSPLPPAVGPALESTQQLNNLALGTEGALVAVPPPGGGTGIMGWLRAIHDFFYSTLSIIGVQRAIKVDVIQTVGGGGGGGDASAANQVIQTTALNAIIAKLIAAPSTEAKQDAAIALLTTINAALGGTLGISGTIAVSNFPATQPVSGTFWQATQPVSLAAAPALVASSAIIGNVRIDQTTPGTTNNVEVSKLPKASSANTPSIAVAGGDVLASNASRKAWGIQNLGTNPLYVRMATGASSTLFHFALAPGSVADDGRGASVMDDTYTGVVSATGTSPRFTAFEL